MIINPSLSDSETASKGDGKLMKKFLSVIIFFIPFSLFPLEYKDALEKNADQYLYYANMETDLERYRSIILNGDISFLEYPYLSDLLLGTLNNEELRLFRNLFYASKGYKFDDNTLTEYFSRFDWYNPTSKDIILTREEKKCIDKIKTFEQKSSYIFNFPNKDILFEEFNGGADQRGALLYLNKTQTFKYIPAETINRVKNISGTWKSSEGKIILLIQEMSLLLGGYIASDPTTPYIKDGYTVIQKFDKAHKITLPVNKADNIIDNNKKWIKIGNSLYYQNDN